MSDPVHRLLATLPDADEDTEAVLRSYTVADWQWDAIREEVKRSGGKTGLAVDKAKRLQRGELLFEHQSDTTACTPPTAAHRPFCDVLENWIRNVGHHFTEDGVRTEIADRERRRDEVLTDEQRTRLIALWRIENSDRAEPPACQLEQGAAHFDVQAEQARSLLDSITRTAA